ncbi:hypothetical protein HYH03_003351 [Edaphochlamys debaryana]|nr:hypothetical protein HYH03_003351 [Edaphochlamys debaryana]|eukprot:KAG2498600.1 hypothetical protein HYH03_003351 [Edaphochlamys debaryana]
MSSEAAAGYEDNLFTDPGEVSLAGAATSVGAEGEGGPQAAVRAVPCTSKHLYAALNRRFPSPGPAPELEPQRLWAEAKRYVAKVLTREPAHELLLDAILQTMWPHLLEGGSGPPLERLRALCEEESDVFAVREQAPGFWSVRLVCAELAALGMAAKATEAALAAAAAAAVETAGPSTTSHGAACSAAPAEAEQAAAAPAVEDARTPDGAVRGEGPGSGPGDRALPVEAAGSDVTRGDAAAEGTASEGALAALLGAMDPAELAALIPRAFPGDGLSAQGLPEATSRRAIAAWLATSPQPHAGELTCAMPQLGEHLRRYPRGPWRNPAYKWPKLKPFLLAPESQGVFVVGGEAGKGHEWVRLDVAALRRAADVEVEAIGADAAEAMVAAAALVPATESSETAAVAGVAAAGDAASPRTVADYSSTQALPLVTSPAPTAAAPPPPPGAAAAAPPPPPPPPPPPSPPRESLHEALQRRFPSLAPTDPRCLENAAKRAVAFLLDETPSGELSLARLEELVPRVLNGAKPPRRLRALCEEEPDVFAVRLQPSTHCMVRLLLGAGPRPAPLATAHAARSRPPPAPSSATATQRALRTALLARFPFPGAAFELEAERFRSAAKRHVAKALAMAPGHELSIGALLSAAPEQLRFPVGSGSPLERLRALCEEEPDVFAVRLQPPGTLRVRLVWAELAALGKAAAAATAKAMVAAAAVEPAVPSAQGAAARAALKALPGPAAAAAAELAALIPQAFPGNGLSDQGLPENVVRRAIAAWLASSPQPHTGELACAMPQLVTHLRKEPTGLWRNPAYKWPQLKPFLLAPGSRGAFCLGRTSGGQEWLRLDVAALRRAAGAAAVEGVEGTEAAAGRQPAAGAVAAEVRAGAGGAGRAPAAPSPQGQLLSALVHRFRPLSPNDPNRLALAAKRAAAQLLAGAPRYELSLSSLGSEVPRLLGGVKLPRSLRALCEEEPDVFVVWEQQPPTHCMVRLVWGAGPGPAPGATRNAAVHSTTAACSGGAPATSTQLQAALIGRFPSPGSGPELEPERLWAAAKRYVAKALATAPGHELSVGALLSAAPEHLRLLAGSGPPLERLRALCEEEPDVFAVWEQPRGTWAVRLLWAELAALGEAAAGTTGPQAAAAEGELPSLSDTGSWPEGGSRPSGPTTLQEQARLSPQQMQAATMAAGPSGFGTATSAAQRLSEALLRRFPAPPKTPDTESDDGGTRLVAAAKRGIARLLAMAPPRFQLHLTQIGSELPRHTGGMKPPGKLRALCDEEPDVFRVVIQGASDAVVRLVCPTLVAPAAELAGEKPPAAAAVGAHSAAAGSPSATAGAADMHRPSKQLWNALSERFPATGERTENAAKRLAAKVLAEAPSHELTFAFLGSEVPRLMGGVKPPRKLRELCEEAPDVFHVWMQPPSTPMVRLVWAALARLGEAAVAARAATETAAAPSASGGLASAAAPAGPLGSGSSTAAPMAAPPSPNAWALSRSNASGPQPSAAENAAPSGGKKHVWKALFARFPTPGPAPELEPERLRMLAKRYVARGLAMAPGHELSLDAVLETMWPHLLAGGSGPPVARLRALCKEDPDVFAVWLQAPGVWMVRLVCAELAALGGVRASTGVQARPGPATAGEGLGDEAKAARDLAAAQATAAGIAPHTQHGTMAATRAAAAVPHAMGAAQATASNAALHPAAETKQERPEAVSGPAVSSETATVGGEGEAVPEALQAQAGRSSHVDGLTVSPHGCRVPIPIPVPVPPVPAPEPQLGLAILGPHHQPSPPLPIPPPPPHPAAAPPTAALPPAPVIVVSDPFTPALAAMLQHCRACTHLGLAVHSYGGAPAVVCLYAPPVAGEEAQAAADAAVYVVDLRAAEGLHGGGRAGAEAARMLLFGLRGLMEDPALGKVVHGREQVRVLEAAWGGAAAAPLLDTRLVLTGLTAMLRLPLPPPPPSTFVASSSSSAAGAPSLSLAAVTAHVSALRSGLAAAGLWADRPDLLAALSAVHFAALRDELGPGEGGGAAWGSRPLSPSQVAAAAAGARHLPELWTALWEASYLACIGEAGLR